MIAHPLVNLPNEMPTESLMKSLLMFAGLSFIPLSLNAAEWNQYRGPNGDGKSSESIDPARFRAMAVFCEREASLVSSPEV